MIRQSVTGLLADLQKGNVNASTLVDQALARIRDPNGEGKRAFIRLYEDQARAVAAAHDMMAGSSAPRPLRGIPISVKDLFDIAGETTTAGSIVLRDAEKAGWDAPVVSRLRAAGAVIVGTTNMSEFAFGGVGTNKHYGTPRNPYDRSLIPGGSSSGGQSQSRTACARSPSAPIPAGPCGSPPHFAVWLVSSQRKFEYLARVLCHCRGRWIRLDPSGGRSGIARLSTPSCPAMNTPFPRGVRLTACASPFPRQWYAMEGPAAH
jgi:hypothetical protein